MVVEVGRTVRVVCVCVQGGPRWDIQGLPHFTEWREFPPEQTLHPPLAAALS